MFTGIKYRLLALARQPEALCVSDTDGALQIPARLGNDLRLSFELGEQTLVFQMTSITRSSAGPVRLVGAAMPDGLVHLTWHHQPNYNVDRTYIWIFDPAQPDQVVHRVIDHRLQRVLFQGWLLGMASRDGFIDDDGDTHFNRMGHEWVFLDLMSKRCFSVAVNAGGKAVQNLSFLLAQAVVPESGKNVFWHWVTSIAWRELQRFPVLRVRSIPFKANNVAKPAETPRYALRGTMFRDDKGPRQFSISFSELVRFFPEGTNIDIVKAKLMADGALLDVWFRHGVPIQCAFSDPNFAADDRAEIRAIAGGIPIRSVLDVTTGALLGFVTSNLTAGASRGPSDDPVLYLQQMWAEVRASHGMASFSWGAGNLTFNVHGPAGLVSALMHQRQVLASWPTAQFNPSPAQLQSLLDWLRADPVARGHLLARIDFSRLPDFDAIAAMPVPLERVHIPTDGVQPCLASESFDDWIESIVQYMRGGSSQLPRERMIDCHAEQTYFTRSYAVDADRQFVFQGKPLGVDMARVTFEAHPEGGLRAQFWFMPQQCRERIVADGQVIWPTARLDYHLYIDQDQAMASVLLTPDREALAPLPISRKPVVKVALIAPNVVRRSMMWNRLLRTHWADPREILLVGDALEFKADGRAVLGYLPGLGEDASLTLISGWPESWLKYPLRRRIFTLDSDGHRYRCLGFRPLIAVTQFVDGELPLPEADRFEAVVAFAMDGVALSEAVFLGPFAQRRVRVGAQPLPLAPKTSKASQRIGRLPQARPTKAERAQQRALREEQRRQERIIKAESDRHARGTNAQVLREKRLLDAAQASAETLAQRRQATLRRVEMTTLARQARSDAVAEAKRRATNIATERAQADALRLAQGAAEKLASAAAHAKAERLYAPQLAREAQVRALAAAIDKAETNAHQQALAIARSDAQRNAELTPGMMVTGTGQASAQGEAMVTLSRSYAIEVTVVGKATARVAATEKASVSLTSQTFPDLVVTASGKASMTVSQSAQFPLVITVTGKVQRSAKENVWRSKSATVRTSTPIPPCPITIGDDNQGQRLTFQVVIQGGRLGWVVEHAPLSFAQKRLIGLWIKYGGNDAVLLDSLAQAGHRNRVAIVRELSDALDLLRRSAIGDQTLTAIEKNLIFGPTSVRAMAR